MPVRYGFEQPDGTVSGPAIEDLTEAQYGFLLLSDAGIGVPRVDRATIDEFVRRADLMQTYLGPVLRNPDGTALILHREDFMTLLPGAWTNWTKVSQRDFNSRITGLRDAYWKCVDSKG